MPGARPGRTILAVVAATLALLMSGLSPAAAQRADAKRAEPDGEQVIITSNPKQHRPLRAALQRLLGKSKGEELSHTGSEVVTVPKARMGHFKQRLQQLGVKVTHLREDWNHILKRDKKPVPMSRSQEEQLAKAKRAPETVGVGVMRTSEAAVAEFALTGGKKTAGSGSTAPDDATSRIVIPINDNQQVTVIRTKHARTEKGLTWRGAVEETGESAVLMWWQDGRVSGVLGYKGRIYTVESMGGDVHAVIEVDPKKLPPDHATKADNPAPGDQAARREPPPPAPPAPKVEPISEADLKALEAKQIVIDVMILYTKKVISRYIRDPQDLTHLAIEQANETFRNSGIGNVSLRLVHAQAIDYDEEGAEQFAHLYRMVDGDGVFKDVRRLRNEKRADLVGLVLEDPTGCGLSTRVAADSEDAYFVVHHSCAAITISIAHEVGHILGARHDRRIDPNNTPFAYGHGHVNPKWRTMMSYQEGCDGCPRIPFWSNPRVRYQGEPTGTLSEDNARVILEQAERVSNFR
jgi:hypothetical protein